MIGGQSAAGRARRLMARLVAPQVRGRVDPRVPAALERRGWAVHHVGRAVYAHGDGLHLLFGVWARREAPPAWADRLGRPSAGYIRRVGRLERRQCGRWMLRDRLGRFLVRLPWWRVPGPVVYRHEPRRPSWYELVWGRS